MAIRLLNVESSVGDSKNQFPFQLDFNNVFCSIPRLGQFLLSVHLRTLYICSPHAFINAGLKPHLNRIGLYNTFSSLGERSKIEALSFQMLMDSVCLKVDHPFDVHSWVGRINPFTIKLYVSEFVYYSAILLCVYQMFFHKQYKPIHGHQYSPSSQTLNTFFLLGNISFHPLVIFFIYLLKYYTIVKPGLSIIVTEYLKLRQANCSLALIMVCFLNSVLSLV